MKKLEFHNNVTFVEACKALLNDSEYKGGLDSLGCVYRSQNNHENRCIMGRAMYGRVDESSPFWASCSAMNVILDPCCGLWHFADVKAAVPWMSGSLANDIQSVHDDIFGRSPTPGGARDIRSESFWSNLIEKAKKADKEFNDYNKKA